MLYPMRALVQMLLMMQGVTSLVIAGGAPRVIRNVEVRMSADDPIGNPFVKVCRNPAPPPWPWPPVPPPAAAGKPQPLPSRWTVWQAINSLQESIQNSPAAQFKKGLAKMQAGSYDEPAVQAKLTSLLAEPAVMFSFTT